ncbi:hypothetical protein BJX61DRAFT_540397 [Aspergillus egyptiacus]|nr:hypothetical protein BJX61DRAFT_540397 [Aspergillus egyptiacus]
MRLSTLWSAGVLSSAALAAEVQDPGTTPVEAPFPSPTSSTAPLTTLYDADKFDVALIKPTAGPDPDNSIATVTLTSVGTSTRTLPANDKALTTTCWTFTNTYTWTYSFSVGWTFSWSASIPGTATATSSSSTTVVTIPTVPAITTGAPTSTTVPGTTVPGTTVPGTTVPVGTGSGTGPDSGSGTGSAPEPGSGSGSGTDSVVPPTSTANAPDTTSTDSVSQPPSTDSPISTTIIVTTTDAEGNVVAVPGASPTALTTTDENGNTITAPPVVPVPVPTSTATGDGTPSVPSVITVTTSTTTTDADGNTITVPQTITTTATDAPGTAPATPIVITTSTTTTDAEGNVVTVPAVITSTAAPTAPAVTTTDDNGNTVTVPGTTSSAQPVPVVTTTDAQGNTVTVPQPVQSITTTDENGSTVIVPVVPVVTTTDAEGNTVTVPQTTPVPVVTTTDENGNTVTVPQSTAPTTTQPVPVVTTTDENGNTVTVPQSTTTSQSVPVVTTTDENGSIVTVPQSASTTSSVSMVTTTDEAGNTVTVPQSTSDPVPSVTTTTDEAGNTVTGGQPTTSGPAETSPMPTPTTDEQGSTVTPTPDATTTTDELGGVVILPGPTTTGPPTTTDGPQFTTTPGPMVTSSVSAISSEFRNLLPTFSSWGIDPKPPLQTSIINGIKGVKDRIDDLEIKLGTDVDPKCPPQKKRGLFDALFDVATNTVGGFLEALGCIELNLEDLSKKVEVNDVEGTKSLLPKLIDVKDDPKDDPEDDNTTASSISSTSTATSTTTTSTCTETTAHQVTVLCKPTSITAGPTTIPTTTCEPSTTVTTTGCSVTDTTTTVTSTATPTPTLVCEAGTCGASCGVGGKADWVNLGPIDCANVPIIDVDELPRESGGTLHVGDPYNNARLAKRDDEPPVDPLPNPENAETQWAYLTALTHWITGENKWLYFRYNHVASQWFPFKKQRTALGIRPLHGCTAIFIVSGHGVWAAHLFEFPVFMALDENRNHIPSPDTFFQNWGFEYPVYGGPEGAHTQPPLIDLLGSDSKPGPLHWTQKPRIFVVTPYHGDSTAPPFSYPERVAWLRDMYASLVYPRGFGPEQALVVGYQATNPQIAGNDELPFGKAIVEATPLQYYMRRDDQVIPVSRFRLWVGGLRSLEWDFWGPPSASTTTTSTNTATSTSTSTATATDSRFGRTQMARRQDLAVTVCPMPTSSMTTTTTTTKSSTATTLITTTKSTSSTTTSTITPAPALPSDTSLVGPQICIEHSNPDWYILLRETTIRELAWKCQSGSIFPPDMLSMGPDSPLVTWQVDDEETWYRGQIHWATDCEGPRQDPRRPMNGEGFNCYSIIEHNFAGENCRSQGNVYGGKRQVGCLVYKAWRGYGEEGVPEGLAG